MKYSCSKLLVFCPSCDLQTSWIAQIDALWEDEYKERWAACRWAYFPEETGVGRLPGQHERELFITDHMDHNTVDTIAGRACVLTEAEFLERERREPKFWRRGITAPEECDADVVWDAAVDLDGATYVAKSFYDYATRQIRPLLRRRDAGSGAVKDSGSAEESSTSARPSQPGDTTAARGTPPRARRGPGSSTEAAAASASTASKPASVSFSDLCRQAQSMLQLSAVPQKLPCREKERDQVYHFLEAAISKVRCLWWKVWIEPPPSFGELCFNRALCSFFFHGCRAAWALHCIFPECPALGKRPRFTRLFAVLQ